MATQPSGPDGDTTSADDAHPGLHALRRLALAALVLGALVTLGTIVVVARGQRSALLLIAFVLWDLAPFALLAAADRASAEWRFRPRAALYVATLLVVAGTVTTYLAVALGGWHGHLAAPFLVVPPASLFVVAFIMIMTAGKSVRRRRR